MTDNKYNYDNSVLSGPGFTEHLVRSGLAPNLNGEHTPRTDAYKELVSLDEFKEEMLKKVTDHTVIKQYYKRNQILDTSGEMIEFETEISLTWDGHIHVKFAPFNDITVKLVIKYISKEYTWSAFCKKDTLDDGSTVLTLTDTTILTDEDYVTFGLIEEGEAFNLEQVRDEYILDCYNIASSNDVSELFKDLIANIEASTFETFLFDSLEDIEDDKLRKDLLANFTNAPENGVDYYFGGNSTGTDVGFYCDKGGRVRCVYDKFMLYKAVPLIKDIKDRGRLEDVVLGYFSSTNTFVFVLPKDLSEELRQEVNFGNKYNNPMLPSDQYTMTEVKDLIEFPYVVSITSKDLVITDVNNCFGVKV